MVTTRRRSARLAQASPVKASEAVLQLGLVAEEQDVEPNVAPVAPAAKKLKRKNKTAIPVVNEPEPSSDPSEESSLPPTNATMNKSTNATTSVPPTPNKLSVNPNIPSTPLNSSALKPPRSEMHPSKIPHTAHSGLHLGFADLKPATVEAARTPTKIGPMTSPLPPPTQNTVAPSSPFTFRYSTQPDELQVDHDIEHMGLSDDALLMMASLRSNTERIRAELVKQKEEEEFVASVQGERRIAKPRGRFSAAHQAMFGKMKSIENHPSAWRLNRGKADANKADLEAGTTKTLKAPSKTSVVDAATGPGLKRTQSKNGAGEADAPKSLKRTQSKANLQGDATPTARPEAGASTTSLGRSLSKTSSIPTAAQRNLKRTRSKANLADSKEAKEETVQTPTDTPKQAAATPATPATQSRIPAPGSVVHPSTVKRLKARFEDDASSNRPKDDDKDANTTPRSRPTGISRVPTARSMIARTRHSMLPRGPGASATPGPRLRQPSLAPTGPATEKVNKVTAAPATPSRFAQLKASFQACIAAGSPSKLAQPSKGVTATGAASKGAAPAIEITKGAAESASGTPKTDVKNEQSEFPALPSVPTATPSRSLFRKMQFTPTTERAVLLQQSPTPLKMGPRSAVTPMAAKTPSAIKADVSQKAKTPSTAIKTDVSTKVKTPSTAIKQPALHKVTYPDLSKYEEISKPAPPVRKRAEENKESKDGNEPSTPQTAIKTTQPLPAKTPQTAIKTTQPTATKTPQTSIKTSQPTAAKTPQTSKAEPSVPGTFSFRSDHTINFEAPAADGFGATRGQSSVRQVRPSVLPASLQAMPGAFPVVASSDKENSLPPSPSPVKEPIPANGIPHGLQSKKRARATWDEEDAENKEDEERRAAKKQRAAHPVGAELFTTAPRGRPGRPSKLTVSASPAKHALNTPARMNSAAAASTTQKKKCLSVSRLNMLAQPKNRR